MANETEPVTESGFTPRQLRLLKASIAVMSALIVLCVIALLAGIYYQSNRIGKTGSTGRGLDAAGTAPPRGAPVTLKVGPGAVVDGMAVEGGALILRLKTPEGSQIVILDLKSGEEIRRIILKAE